MKAPPLAAYAMVYAVAACATPARDARAIEGTPRAVSPAASPILTNRALRDPSAPATDAATDARSDATLDARPAPRAENSAPRMSAGEVRALLWPGAPRGPDTSACDALADPYPCLLAVGWAAEPALRERALGVYRDLGTVFGLSRAFVMNGGYRGAIRIVPEAPVGRYAQHAEWMELALREQDRFYARLVETAGASVAYRWRGLAVRFFRSVARRTPAAFAQDWSVSYNVEGGINDGAERVRATILHEVFHLNDADHGDWSMRALQPLYAAIIARCGARTACLAPYAPNTLRVRGGTFYSFQPGNDVREYAAELAVRFYLERSGQYAGRPFRCGPSENVRAWDALGQEFFGGAGPAPVCPP